LQRGKNLVSRSETIALNGFEISKTTALNAVVVRHGAVQVFMAPFTRGSDHWQEIVTDICERIFHPGRDLAKGFAANDPIRL
jgi:hypothetical protein